MKVRLYRLILLLLLAIALIPAETFGESKEDASGFSDNKKIYIKLVEKINGSVDTVSSKVSEALAQNGWKVVAAFYPALPDNCKYKSKVLVIHNEKYWKTIFAASPNAKFVYPLRVNIYSDEKGTNISLVNPVALNRLISQELDNMSLEALKSLTTAVQGAGGGQNVSKEEGTLLDGNRTHGIGGGLLEDNIVKIHTVRNKTENVINSIIKDLQSTIKRNKNGYYLVYSIDMRENGIMLFGISKKEVEKAAFTITGEKRVTKLNACPGIDHAPAFPLEITVDSTGKSIKVETLREMYRMNAYFGDTGEMAFMKHYFMPGKIEDEIITSTYMEVLQ
ncbi:MAG: hypothetical protein HQK88_11915 [Nitrospirae bacterium]|nr:hypothetical protein [Nitrospirota bacterium]MBF0535682.1 hypothetical protein [Nitrospirota bacterium]MBF0617507.1 hypothetical protein [Nitrospirota bacterium]